MPLYFSRHGQTHWNETGLIQGQMNSKLTDLGITQAKELAVKAKHFQIEQVISSDLGRAVETGTIVAQYLGAELETMTDIRERHFGILQGCTRSEQPQLWHAFDRKHLSNEINIQGCESATQVATRIKRTIARLDAKYVGKNILIVGHGEWLRILLNMRNNQAAWSDFGTLPKNCEILELENEAETGPFVTQPHQHSQLCTDF